MRLRTIIYYVLYVSNTHNIVQNNHLQVFARVRVTSACTHDDTAHHRAIEIPIRLWRMYILPMKYSSRRRSDTSVFGEARAVRVSDTNTKRTQRNAARFVKKWKENKKEKN